MPINFGMIAMIERGRAVSSAFEAKLEVGVMSQVPSDPKDDDNVRGILESMWELTSADGTDNDPDSRLISIDPDPKEEDAPSSASSGSSAADDPASNGVNGRRPLMDVLNGEERAADNGGDDSYSTTDASTDGELSALQYKEDPTRDQHAASEEQPMAPDTGHDERNGSHLNGNHSLNGVDGEYRVDLKGGKPDDVAHPQAPQGGNPSAPPNSTAAASAPPADENQNVKRQMAPFKDTRMSKLSAGSPGTPATPQPPAAAAQPAPTPQPQAPIRANVPAVQNPQAPAPAGQGGHDHLVPSGRDAAAELMRPVLRQWLGENMPKIVETALEIEAKETLHPDDPNNKHDK